MVAITREGPVTVFKMGRDSIAKTIRYFVHSFLFEDTLIDTGPFHVCGEFLPLLERYGVARIINTHQHEDHSGNNGPIQDKFRVPLYAHPDALPFLANPKEMNLNITQHIFWKLPEPSRGEPIGSTVRSAHHVLEVIHTPGHTRDHICLYEPENKLLFAGDLYCGMVKYFREEEDYDQIISSLRTVHKLDFHTMFCCLKGTVAEGRGAIKRKIDFMERLREQALELQRMGVSSARIRKKLLGAEGAIYYATRGKFSKQHVIDSALRTA